ncbi:hypothetical protein TcasGA2_TC001481 [Tribolium castaneum]|uniref:Integrase catalytic domain-containing protein n=1 Tax=Tribolium castaneum TaxID=7070 RepID=D7GXV4_TRICA|nr:hypothetical protein TcasGA2_TC001481 [Tribolium castaneum]
MDNLKKRYFLPGDPLSFSSVNKLVKSTNIPKKEIEKWLEGVDSFTLHKQVRRRFPRNSYHVTNIDDLFQADLIDMRNIAKYNPGVNYLLTVIDVFSKYAWVKPLRTKTGADVANAFREIFEDRVPINLQTDKGKEFLAKNVQNLFKQYDINYYVTNNPDVKAAVIERFNKTFKTKMYKYFTYSNSFEYHNVLSDLVNAYNNSYHRTIKMTPNQVNPDNILQVYNNILSVRSKDNKRIKRRSLYKVGDYVRITKYKHVFEKGYVNNWSGEIFKITNVIMRQPVVYKISDLMDEPIDGINPGEHLIIKELVVLNTDKPSLKFFLFKPPEDLSTLPHRYQRQADWLTYNFHGLCWSSGISEYEKLNEILHESTKDSKCIYVKGLEKKRFISNRLPDIEVVNIEDLECPSLRYLREHFDTRCCDNHIIKNAVCALENVQNLATWYNEYYTTQKLPREDISKEEEKTSCCCFSI